MTSRPFSTDQLKSLEHCLRQLDANGIARTTPAPGSWYSGKRSDFIARHKAALALILELISSPSTETDITVRGVSRADALRTEHRKGCVGYEDCECFGRYWSHADIYAMQLREKKVKT